MDGSLRQVLMERRRQSSSWERITSTPTAAFSWNTRPARIASTMAGVPPTSRWAGSSRYRCSLGLT